MVSKTVSRYSLFLLLSCNVISCFAKVVSNLEHLKLYYRIKLIYQKWEIRFLRGPYYEGIAMEFIIFRIFARGKRELTFYDQLLKLVLISSID